MKFSRVTHQGKGKVSRGSSPPSSQRTAIGFRTSAIQATATKFVRMTDNQAMKSMRCYHLPPIKGQG